MQTAFIWLWLWGCPTQADKQPKNTKNAFFACFWAYVGQSHNHIGWATSMPFASINPTNSRTNPWNFHKKILRNGDFKLWPSFDLGFHVCGHFMQIICQESTPILNIFLWKFHGLVLGLVGLIDLKGIDVAQPIWLWGGGLKWLKVGRRIMTSADTTW